MQEKNTYQKLAFESFKLGLSFTQQISSFINLIWL